MPDASVCGPVGIYVSEREMAITTKGTHLLDPRLQLNVDCAVKRSCLLFAVQAKKYIDAVHGSSSKYDI